LDRNPETKAVYNFGGAVTLFVKQKLHSCGIFGLRKSVD